MSTKPGLLVRSWNVSVDLQDCTSHTLTQTGLERRRFIHELYDEPLTWMILYEYDVWRVLLNHSFVPREGVWDQESGPGLDASTAHIDLNIHILTRVLICSCTRWSVFVFVVCLIVIFNIYLICLHIKLSVWWGCMWAAQWRFSDRILLAFLPVFVCVWEIKWKRSWSCRIWVAATNTSWTAEKLKGNGGSE